MMVKQSPEKKPSSKKLGKNSTKAHENSREKERDLFPIVALGASAGGLESFEKFFLNMPPDSGMAFIVVVHLDPQHKTMLPELLTRYTRMEVVLVEEGMFAEPNRVHVIPSNREMTISGGRLHLDEPLAPRGVRHTIDYLLRSLAEDAEEYAVAVILSGTGSDGTQGIKEVKLAGGLVLVEDEQSAKYTGMPQSAIATGVVDLTLPADQIGAKLLELANRPLLARRNGENPEQDIASNLNNIFRIINSRIGHDFSAYKINTMVRRIERRMVVNDVQRVGDYIGLLKNSSEECHSLFREVLIGVTSFFRDAEGFAALEKLVIPKLFENRGPDEAVRVWLAGCATGEEAYSIAILLREYQREQRLDHKVQIFASDLDPEAIAYARTGIYPEGISSDLSRRRLEKYFSKVGDRYEVAKSLREMIIFSQHNLIKDPPFSRLDLLICRNLLIYLNPEVQKRLLALFYQTLRPGGFLFLGRSETVGSATDLFRSLSKKWKIFDRCPNGHRVNYKLPITMPKSSGSEPLRERKEDHGYSNPGQLAEHLLIQRYSPPCVVINERHEVLYYSTRTTRYLEQPIGEPTQDIMRLVREELRPALRAAIHKVLESEEAVVYSDLRVEIDGHKEAINLRVEPLLRPASAKGLALVIFEPPGSVPVATTVPLPLPSGMDGEKDKIITQLEEQLRITHAELQSTIERLESSNEEMKSSNEELMSMNEEFQSTNEELETSKEELQALNEELVTVNAELESKVDELGQTNDDLQNLLNSSEIITIFLDRDLRVKRFTPRIIDLFNLIDSDLGRPLQHLSGAVHYPELVQDSEKVLDTLRPVERELTTDESKHYLMRMLPYRTASDHIDGVVVTFTDITSRHKVEEYHSQIAAIVEASNDAIIGKTLDGTITSWNRGAEEIYGFSAEEMVGNRIERIVPDNHRDELTETLQRIRLGQRINSLETEALCKDGRRLQISLSLSPITDRQGRAVSVASISRDVTEAKEQERQLARSEQLQRERAHELKALMEAVPAAVWIAEDPECKRIDGNRASYELLRLESGVNLSKSAPGGESPNNFRVFQDGRELAAEALPMQLAARTGKPVTHFEEEIVFDDGGTIHVIGNAVPILNDAGQPRGAIAAFIDITLLKQAEEQLRRAKQDAETANQVKSEFLANVSHEVRTPLTGMMNMLDLLERTQLDEKQQELLDLTQTSATTLLQLIEDILDFARIEAGKLMFKTEPFRLRHWFEELIAPFEVKASAKNIELHWSLADTLPDLVASDSKRLRQVLANLIENSIKFTEGGSIDVLLEPAKEQPVDTEHILIDIQVKDTGIGIEKNKLDSLFKNFSQIDSSHSRSHGGLGLGLAISRKIISELGGTLEASSSVGEGSRFTCRVPLILVSSESSSFGTGAKQEPELQEKALLVLLVEDNQAIREGMRKLLTHFKWQVRVAEDGHQALELWDKEPFEAILMDVQMPGIDGLQVTKKIREKQQGSGRHIPIIGLTAHALQKNREECLQAGMDDVLVKPVNIKTLQQMVYRVIGPEASQ